jgi:hypothetical protein
MAKRIREAAIKEAICHFCKEPISVDTYTRSLVWAFQMPGVRWALCSVRCAEEMRDSGLDERVLPEA